MSLWIILGLGLLVVLVTGVGFIAYALHCVLELPDESEEDL